MHKKPGSEGTVRKHKKKGACSWRENEANSVEYKAGLIKDGE